MALDAETRKRLKALEKTLATLEASLQPFLDDHRNTISHTGLVDNVVSLTRRVGCLEAGYAAEG